MPTSFAIIMAAANMYGMTNDRRPNIPDFKICVSMETDVFVGAGKYS